MIAQLFAALLGLVVKLVTVLLALVIWLAFLAWFAFNESEEDKR